MQLSGGTPPLLQHRHLSPVVCATSVCSNAADPVASYSSDAAHVAAMT